MAADILKIEIKEDFRRALANRDIENIMAAPLR